MSTALSLLPLLLVMALYAATTKLAAKLLRSTRLSWQHAIVFGVLAAIIGGTGAFLRQLAGVQLNPVVAIFLGLGAQLVFAGWYLGPRAHTAAGAPIAFKAGMLLAAITNALVLALGAMAAIAVPLLEHASQA
jgi:hypothetical protein